MSKPAIAAVLIIAALHIYFSCIEMLWWESKGDAIMASFDAKMLERTKAMAANQGLYNLFISAGLIWSVIKREHHIALFFLLFVVIAGVFGGLTIGPKLFAAQAVPGLLALAAVFWSNRSS